MEDFLALLNFGGRSSKSCTQFITPDSRHVDWKKFRGNTPNSPEVIEPNMLNFKPNFKFSQLKFFGGSPPSSGVR